ncbi:MAG: class I SAM-dependent methyltransferase, partial [Pseudomonadales bacterium]|nr:class I SAM-dependent methyltransferase [Pseudomonadales bacterium]
MYDSSPSRTAQATAYLRALHLYIDDAPPVFTDQLAIRLLPALQRQQIRSMGRLARLWPRRMRPPDSALTAIRAQVLVRARFAEDTLAVARSGGISRYLILGAGLDTFALRQPQPGIEVVEIDHPATQNWKRWLLGRSGLSIPALLSFLPVDFEKTALPSVWVDKGSIDFVSWLGTTYYLSRDSIRSTLTALSQLTRPGAQLVFDYWNENPTGSGGSALLWGTRLAVALQGEPLRSLFSPDEIERFAAECGWHVLQNCSPAAQNQRYLSNRR